MVHPANFIDYMQQTEGVINADVDFDHAFLQMNLRHKYVERVMAAIETGIICQPNVYKFGVKSKPVTIRPEPIARIKKIWYEGLKILIYKNYDGSIKGYSPIYSNKTFENNDSQQVLELPPLKSMNPIGQLQNPTLGIFIRKPVPIEIAWKGHDLAQMIASGMWVYPFADGAKPIWRSEEELMNSGAYVYYVSRDFFHAVTDIQTYEWNIEEAKTFVDFHKIIENGKFGFTDYEPVTIKMETILE